MTAFLSLRLSFSSTGCHRRDMARIILSTALSLMVTLMVMSVMEYLQEGRLERIRDVQSFDITVKGDFKDELSVRYPGARVFLYAEEEALVNGRAVSVRYIDDDYDGGLRRLSGDFSSLAVPYSLWFSLEGREATLTMLRRGRSGAMLPGSVSCKVSGIYSTSLGRGFDDTHVFLPLTENAEGVMTAVKGAGRKTAEELRGEGYEVTAWEEREAGLYSAFLFEKTMLCLVLCFLFVIILVSLKSKLRSFYESKRKERAELEVLGMPRARLSLVFFLSTLYVIALSILAGALLFFAARPFSEKAAGHMLYTSVSLRFPWPLFLLLSIALVLSAALLSFLAGRREARHSLLEVLNDECPSA